MKAPTEEETKLVKNHTNSSDSGVVQLCSAALPLAMSATTAWEVPQKFEGALSLAITPNKAIGP